MRQNCALGIATDYGLNDGGIGVRVLVRSIIFFSSYWLCDPLRLLSKGHMGLGGESVNLSIQVQLVPRSRKYACIHSLHHASPWHIVCLVKHGENLNFFVFVIINKYINKYINIIITEFHIPMFILD
jgi:hypothetical protein